MSCLSVCLDVPYLLQNGKPQRAEILRDDSPWDGKGFRLKNIRIRRTVSKKIACIGCLTETTTCVVAKPLVLFNLKSPNLYYNLHRSFN